MSMAPTDPELLKKPLAQTLPAIGGLDLLTPKTSVNPGTLQDCLNYEISRESGYKLADGMLRYSGKSYNTVKRPVCGTYTPPPENFLVVTGNESATTSGIALYSYGAGGLTEVSRLSLGGSNFTASACQFNASANKVYFVYTKEAENQSFLGSVDVANDGTLSNFSSIVKFDDSEETTQAIAITSDETRAIVGWSRTGVDTLALIDIDSGSVLDTITPSTGTDVRDLTLSADETRIIATESTNSVLLFSFGSDTLVEEDALSLSANEAQSVYILDSTKVWVTGTAKTSVISYDSDTLSSLNSAATGGTSIVANESTAYTREGGYTWNGSTVVKTSSHDLGSLRELSIGPNATYIATTAPASTSGILDLWDTSDLSTTVGGLTDVVGGRTYSSTFLPERQNIIEGGNYKVSLDGSTDFIGTIKPINIDTGAGTICYQIISGTNEALFRGNTDLRVYPDRTDTTIYATISSQDLETYTGVSDYITKYVSNNAALAADDFKPPGAGPITALFELNDEVYAVRDVADRSSGALYKTTDLDDLSTAVSWEQVDMGNSVDYDGGRNRFITVNDQEFLDEAASPPDPVTDALGSIAETYHTVESASTNGSGRATSWEDRDKVFLDDESSATARVGVSSVGSWSPSQRLKVTGFNIGEGISDPVSVEGVTVEIRAKYRGFLTTVDDADIRMKTAQLTGAGDSDNKADATVYSVSRNGSLETSEITYTLGGSTDTWNMTDASTDNVFSEDFGVEMDFEAKSRNGNGGAGGSTTPKVYFSVFAVKVTVHFENSTSKVYFWDGATDVAEGTVAGYSVVEGAFDKNNAKGNITLYDVTNPNNIVADLEIRSAPNGAGQYYADTDGELTGGSFPSWSEMQDENSLTQTIKANFYIDADKEAVYGVTGAGPAFSFDGTYLRTIRAPIALSKDKPRHIAEHQQHLVLGYDSGSILVSVAGRPDNFSGQEGASEFGFGDRVTGLLPLSGNALGIFCEQSTQALVGTSINNFTQQIISKSTGAIEYSTVNMGQPIYCDFRGVSSVAASEKYGDFGWGRLSQLITEWLQPRLQENSGYSPSLLRIRLALPVRNKNQYRLFFNDGYVLTMTLFGANAEQPMFTLQNFDYTGDESLLPIGNYTPSAALSTVLSDGQELNMIGTEDGDIYVLDQGTGILGNTSLTNYEAFMVFNPFNGGAPHMNMKYHEALIHGLSSGGQELTVSAGVNYLEPAPTAFEETITMGSLSDSVNLSRIPDRVSAYLPNVTDGFSLKIESEADGNLPHTIQAITLRPTPLSDRNSAPKNY